MRSSPLVRISKSTSGKSQVYRCFCSVVSVIVLAISVPSFTFAAISFIAVRISSRAPQLRAKVRVSPVLFLSLSIEASRASRGLGGKRSKLPMVLSLTLFLCKLSTSFFRNFTNSSIRAFTSKAGRFQFSVEKAKRVRYGIRCSTQYSTTCRTVCTPFS